MGAFTVTITQSGSTAAGTDGCIIVVTGQNASPIGATASAQNTTPSLAITPNATGSWVYGSNLGLTGTYTPNGSTTYKTNHSGQGLEYIALRSTATTTAATPVTLGGSAGVNSISICLCEILAGTGALAEDSSSPGGFNTTTLTATSPAFNPPANSLIVLMVQLNGGSGTVNLTVSDTSGLSLTWTPQIAVHTTGTGYSGVLTALMPPLADKAPYPISSYTGLF